MTMTTGEPKDSPALAEATHLCRDKLGPPSAAELDRGLDGFLARIAAREPRPRRFLRWSLAGVAVALFALLVVEVAPTLRRASAPTAPTLTYRIEGGTALAGGYLRQSSDKGMNVLFNEGSRLALAPGTRGRIRVVNRDGAHVGIERGKASFRVAHQSNRRWLVDVGPFLVTVTGTVFTASWDPLTEELDLKIEEGSVLVSGPVSAGDIPLRAGQRLVANVAKVQTVITEETPGQANQEPAGDFPTPAVPPPGLGPAPGSSPPAVAPTAKLGSDRQWSRKLARGQWDRILAEAKLMGVDAALDETSSEDLLALANAARFRHRLGLARSALLAQRRRFPASPRTLEATYLLGRVDEAQEAGTAQAIAWYDEYLVHAPTGPLAGEALGRKMTLTDRLAGPTRARPLAEEYLRRFPKGNYAASARELLAP